MRLQPGAVSEAVLIARAYLNRVAEPASIPLWALVRAHGPEAVAEAVRAGRVPGAVSEATAVRAAGTDPRADLEAAQRHGIRLVVPESDEWPHFAMAALEAAALRRLETYQQGERKHAEGGEPIPPLALWVRGSIDLAPVGVRSAAIVGSRAATPYGERIAYDFASQLAARDVVVVSGGAFGIDAAAHRGALAGGGPTVVVSAGGLDRPYPQGNAALFAAAAEHGLLISESPPGAAPARRRFLTRNRLIATLGGGTVVVEAAGRSGAMNTANHAGVLGRPLMAVPGPIDSTMSVGCHDLIARERYPAQLVTGAADVLAVVGSAGDVPLDQPVRRRGDAGPAADLAERLDELDATARRVFDGFPARGWVGPDNLAVATGLPTPTVLRALPMLELVDLIEASPDGEYRIARPPPAREQRRPGAGSLPAVAKPAGPDRRAGVAACAEPGGRPP